MSEYPNPFAPPQAAEPVTVESMLDQDERPLAEHGERFFGNMVDGLFMVGCVVLAFMIAIPMNSLTRSDELSMLVGGVVAFGAYNAVQIHLILSRGQSVGKIAMGTKIVRMNGGPVGLLDGVLLRGWLPMAVGMVVGALFSLPDALFIFRRDRRCLHDHMAGTKVVRM